MDEISELGSTDSDLPYNVYLNSKYLKLTDKMRQHADIVQNQLNQLILAIPECENKVRSIKEFENKIKNAKKVTNLFDQILTLISEAPPSESANQV